MTVKFTMLGVRFLNVDFMRINFACASPTVYVIRLFCTVVKGRTAAWSASRSQSRMEASERARSMVARAAGQPHFCLATERLCQPPGRGTFWFQIFIQASSPETWRKTIFGGEGGCWRGKWGGLFWATSFGKNYRRRDRHRLVPPSTVPRCAILSVGSTGGIGQ